MVTLECHDVWSLSLPAFHPLRCSFFAKDLKAVNNRFSAWLIHSSFKSETSGPYGCRSTIEADEHDNIFVYRSFGRSTDQFQLMFPVCPPSPWMRLSGWCNQPAHAALYNASTVPLNILLTHCFYKIDNIYSWAHCLSQVPWWYLCKFLLHITMKTHVSATPHRMSHQYSWLVFLWCRSVAVRLHLWRSKSSLLDHLQTLQITA